MEAQKKDEGFTDCDWENFKKKYSNIKIIKDRSVSEKIE